jgi:hypothetical protein
VNHSFRGSVVDVLEFHFIGLSPVLDCDGSESFEPFGDVVVAEMQRLAAEKEESSANAACKLEETLVQMAMLSTELEVSEKRSQEPEASLLSVQQTDLHAAQERIHAVDHTRAELEDKKASMEEEKTRVDLEASHPWLWEIAVFLLNQLCSGRVPMSQQRLCNMRGVTENDSCVLSNGTAWRSLSPLQRRTCCVKQL